MIESASEFLRLIESDDSLERRRAVWDEAAPGVWADILDRYPDRNEAVALSKALPDEILERLATDADPRVRSLVADKRRLPMAVRERLARDSDSSVRARVACNAKSPLELLRMLANDPERFVRDAASDRIERRA